MVELILDLVDLSLAKDDVPFPPTMAENKKDKLQTSKEVYHRILWDPQLSAEDFTIGYEERFDGLCEIPLPEFVPDDEIPWHRVQYIKGTEGIVWDRRTRLDLISSPQASESDALMNHLSGLGLVHTSAVVLVPPRYLWPQIQAFRARYDRHYPRWMPHITLLYGFVGPEHHSIAAELFERRLESLSPFTVTLCDTGCFDHKGSSTIYLVPQSEPKDALLELQRRLEDTFPQCREQSTNGFTPHLTIGQTRGRAEDLLEGGRRKWRSSSFVVDEVHLISREKDSPFVVTHVVPLNQRFRKVTPVEEAISSDDNIEKGTARIQKEAALLLLEKSCRKLDPSATCHLTGSHFLGVEEAGSDIDVICGTSAEIEIDAFFSGVVGLLNKSGSLDHSRSIPDAIVPVLELVIDGVDIDLSHVRCPDEVLPSELPFLRAPQLRRLEPPDRRTALGLIDTLKIADAMNSMAAMEAFRRLNRVVRVWARSRALFSHAYGFLGGFSWALLSAWCCLDQREILSASTEELLLRFFEKLVDWDWSSPIGLTQAALQYQPIEAEDHMPIMTSIPPVTNSARAVTESTCEVLNAEFERGKQIVERCFAGTRRWEELFQKIDPPATCSMQIVLDISARNEVDRAECLGWLRQHVVSFIHELEDEHELRVRPFPPRTSLGVLSALPPDLVADIGSTLDEFRECFERWQGRPLGSEISIEMCPWTDR